MIARHGLAIVLLPGTVTLVVPALILAADGPELGTGLAAPWGWLAGALGAGLIAAGIGLWAWTVRLFATRGHGTLAPWDPTQRLVVDGPYRHVRNPMISAVLAILVGEAALLGSVGIAIWALAFVVVNHIYFLAVEEPGLERRFGGDYRDYKRAVPRWIPRGGGWPRRHGRDS